MQLLDIPATSRSPAISFDGGAGTLALKGESYPEDAAALFGPVLRQIQQWLLTDPRSLAVDLELTYFNSSTAKALMNLFQMLEAAAERGWSIVINWRHGADDETMAEFGEDFAEDFEHAKFQLIAL